ncbi:MAG: hypothetical protein ACFFDH_03380 [Promethearchaeota archaeon]
MRLMQMIVGLIKDGFEDTKATWKLRKEQPQLFIWLTQMTYLGLKFRELITRKYVFTENELRDNLKRVNNLVFTLKTDMHGEIVYSIPRTESEIKEKIKESKEAKNNVDS